MNILDEFQDVCPECGSTDVRRNSSDFIICDNCGYEEVSEDELGVCAMCGEETPYDLLEDGLCPMCQDQTVMFGDDDI